MTIDAVPHWADHLRLRDEVVAGRGHVDGLQMSLHAAVYKTDDVPYQDAGYWGEITEPAPRLVGFMADIARRLGTDADANALYRLDQGMGGGKSHALVGLYHLANDPDRFFASDVGQQVAAEAKQRAGTDLTDLECTRPVVLTADRFSPGVASETFGPARTLHERFLWVLFDAHASREGRETYERHRDAGTNKQALTDALRAVDRPVLILLDELMDYALALAATGDEAAVAAEQGFLNALFDAVDDLPRVAMVTVLISTDRDEPGYEGRAGSFREYIAARLERNGLTLSVNEPQDFGAIITRRIFQRPAAPLPVGEVARHWIDIADDGWRNQVFNRLPGARQLPRFAERLARSYPFHPDLLDLVEHDWVRYAGFQQVRSTVAIFSTAAFDWLERHAAGEWTPPLIGVGDIPLPVAADQVLNSGILRGNDRAITALRQVAQTDVISTDRQQGRAAQIDARLAGDDPPWRTAQPTPAVRMGTALWMYSVANRGQRAGATKPEILAAAYVPDDRFGLAAAEEVFNALVDDEDGLGALDVIEGTGGGAPTRYALSTRNTLRMVHRNARNRVDPDDYGPLTWERVQHVARAGAAFDELRFVQAPDRDGPMDVTALFADLDEARKNRLVVLDPRRWTLLNGRDSATRDEIEQLLGVTGNLAPSYAASCVIAVVNTQRRDGVNRRAREAVAWQLALRDLDHGSELADEAHSRHRNAVNDLDRELRRAYQHYCILDRNHQGSLVRFHKIDDDDHTALSGNDVWERLRADDRAVGPEGLSGAYLQQLVDLSDRRYTLSEITDAFWSNPRFPLVPSLDVARRAIFDALQQGGKQRWTVVGRDDTPRRFTGPAELPVGSNTDYVCNALELEEDARQDPVPGSPDAEPGQAGTLWEPRRAGGPPAPPYASEARDRTVDGNSPAEYAWHVLELGATAISDPERRQHVMNLLYRLGDVLDPAHDADTQLIEMRVRVNAARGDLDEVERLAREAGAAWREEEDLL